MSVSVGDKATADWANKRPPIDSGQVTITPSGANTPTSKAITFTTGRFSSAPIVVATPNTTVPGTTVTGVGVTGVSTSGATIWVTRSNTSDTAVNWVAVGT